MSIRIDHENGENVNICLDDNETENEFYFIKKWWINHTFKDKNGNDLEFRGWINTVALDERDFPDMLEGTFWAKSDETTIQNGEQMMEGYFDIGFGEDGNYVLGNVYPVYLESGIDYNNLSRSNTNSILSANEPLSPFPYFEAKIEDCLDLEMTYIIKVLNLKEM